MHSWEGEHVLLEQEETLLKAQLLQGPPRAGLQAAEAGTLSWPGSPVGGSTGPGRRAEDADPSGSLEGSAQGWL